jgi:hypothetical protein
MTCTLWVKRVNKRRTLHGNGHARNNGRNCCFLRGLVRHNNVAVFSTESDSRLYNSDTGAMKLFRLKS